MVDVTQQSAGPADALPGHESKGWVNGILAGIFALRVPLVIGLVTVAALTLPDQVREIHRILTQERTVFYFYENWHWLLCLLSLVALSIVLWQTSRQHAEDFLEDVPGERRRNVALDIGVGPARNRYAASARRRARHLAQSLGSRAVGRHQGRGHP